MWTTSPGDSENLAAQQSRLLKAAAGWVTPGGSIVFSNCSHDPLEGEALHSAFLAAESRVADDPIRAGEVPEIDPFLTARGTLRTTPADLQLGSPAISGLDGFFAARMQRLG